MRTLPVPRFNPSPDHTACLSLGVASMKDHMTDEGWQITYGLSQNGYRHVGYGLEVPLTDMREVIETQLPGTIVLQDKREWEIERGSFRDPHARFRSVNILQNHPEIFNLTILKDAQQRPQWHAEAAKEMACHAWIVYYHPDIVHHLAPYTRRQHLIRTYHSLDPAVVPTYSPENREGCLFSGAVSGAYPERQHILRMKSLPIAVMQHPGYHRKGCNTPDYFRTLTKYKVALCTSSIYGYALRKIIEATAAGCIVITDLPVEDQLPCIDNNLVRINPDISQEELTALIHKCCAEYDPEVQCAYADEAKWFYDYKRITRLLVCDIANLRETWKDTLT
jgi:hypothetical protein